MFILKRDQTKQSKYFLLQLLNIFIFIPVHRRYFSVKTICYPRKPIEISEDYPLFYLFCGWNHNKAYAWVVWYPMLEHITIYALLLGVLCKDAESYRDKTLKPDVAHLQTNFRLLYEDTSFHSGMIHKTIQARKV